MATNLFGIILIMGQLGFAAIQKPTTQRGNAVAKLQYTPEMILKQVLAKKNLQFKPEIPMPELNLQSKTPLKKFQDAIEPQWGFRPDVFTNAFIILKNEIYLMDDAAYYKKMKRCVDDSMAHELTHYVQVKYQNYDISDDSLEMEAIDVQTWFRDNFCKIKP